MKILILPKYSAKGPSSRYRFYNYNKYFDHQKISVVYKPLLGDNYIDSLYASKRGKVLLHQLYGVLKRFFFILFKSKNFDLLIIEKELFPNCPYFIEKLLLGCKKYALDFDDYIAVDYKTNNIKRVFLSDKIDDLVFKANFVTVGNHWYFDELKIGNLEYLPTVINIEKYPLEKKIQCSDAVTIVWIGSPSTAKYLEIVKLVLQKLSKQHKIVLKAIGATIAVEGVDVVLVKWNEETEVRELLTSDIGIMPLYETLWENGKCGFKLIQYMASGLPVVASPAPANYEIVKNGNGFIAENEEDWFNYLEKLILDSKLRIVMGLEGRKRIEQFYTYQIWGDKYAKMILDANS